MTILQPKQVFGSQWVVGNKGSTVPAWYSTDGATFHSNIQDRSKWWGPEGSPGTYVDFYYSVNGNHCYVQYGQDVPVYASARFFSEELIITNEVLNSDGSVDADVAIHIGFVGGHKTTASVAGWSVVSNLVVAGTTVYTFTGNTIDDTFGSAKPNVVNTHVHIPAQGTETSVVMKWNSHYPNGESADLSANVGLALFNPTPPTYVPMSIRKGGKWKALDAHNGFIKIRKSGTWVDKSEEQVPTSMHENTGHNRIRRSGKWLQLPRMHDQ